MHVISAMLSQLIDPYWTFLPVLIAYFYSWACLHGESKNVRQLVALGLIWLWSIRLTHSYFRRCALHLTELPSSQPYIIYCRLGMQLVIELFLSQQLCSFADIIWTGVAQALMKRSAETVSTS